MIEFMELTKAEDFRRLSGDEILIVEWRKNNHSARGIKAYSNWRLKPNGGGDGQDEIICQKKDNIYFNSAMFEEGKSWAVSAYAISKEANAND